MTLISSIITFYFFVFQMGELTVWNLSTKSSQYAVDSVADKRRGMFNDVGAIVALAQRRDAVAVAFRNHRVALFDARDARTTLTPTRFFDVTEEFGSTGLIRALFVTETQVYVATVSGNYGLVIFDSWT